MTAYPKKLKGAIGRMRDQWWTRDLGGGVREGRMGTRRNLDWGPVLLRDLGGGVREWSTGGRRKWGNPQDDHAHLAEPEQADAPRCIDLRNYR